MEEIQGQIQGQGEAIREESEAWRKDIWSKESWRGGEEIWWEEEI